MIILEQTSPDPTRGKDPSRRVIRLHKDNEYTVSIGRASASKSASSLNVRPALPNNALFDVRGISKIHGFVYLDFEKYMIFYEDNKSRHGSKVTQDSTVLSVDPEMPISLFDLSNGIESGVTEYIGEIFMSPNLASTQSLKLKVYIEQLDSTKHENDIKERVEPSSQISTDSRFTSEVDTEVKTSSTRDSTYEPISKEPGKDSRESCVPDVVPEIFDDESDGNDREKSCAPSEHSDNPDMTCKHTSFEFTSTPRGSSFSQIGDSDESEFAGLSESDESDHLCLDSDDEHTASFFDFGVLKGQDLEANASSTTLISSINVPQDSSSDVVTLTFDVEENLDSDSLASSFAYSKDKVESKTQESQETVNQVEDDNNDHDESSSKLKRDVLELIEEQQKSLLTLENLPCTEGLKRKLEDTDFETECISPLASVLQPPVIIPMNCNLPVNPDFPVVTVETTSIDTNPTSTEEPKDEPQPIDGPPVKKLRSTFSQLKTFAWGVAAGSVMTVAALIATSPNHEQM